MALWGLAKRILPRWSLSHRHAHTAAGKHLFDLRPGYLPFEITPEEAQVRYQRWQSTRWFTPSNLLTQGSYTLTPAMLPYWAFTLEAKIYYTGAVSTHTKGSKGAPVWRDVGWTSIPRHTFSPDESEMLVNAAFQHRRDFLEAMKKGVDLSYAHSLTRAQAEAHELEFPGVLESNIALHPPAMKKSIAWEFALRGAHTLGLELATQLLKDNHDADQVKDVNAVISPLNHQVSLIYVPAYSLQYVHGEGHNVHGERQPLKFDGLISGLRDGGVAGDRHVSVHKATAAGGGLTLGLMGILSVISPLIGADPFMWTSFDIMFPVLGVGATSGLLAQMAPGFLGRQAENRRMAREAQLEATASGTSILGKGAPSFDPGSRRDPEEWARTNLEWSRWEASDQQGQGWNPEKRARWAQHLLEAQHSRRRERRRRQQQAQRDHERRLDEEIREERRRTNNDFMSGAKGRSDYKGYYNALGLDPTASHVSQEDIKRAFRKSAMRWHPDKHADAAGKRKARDKFQLIRSAYDTLKDPESRKSYDLGQVHIHRN